jgi:hypothetical protein
LNDALFKVPFEEPSAVSTIQCAKLIFHPVGMAGTYGNSRLYIKPTKCAGAQTAIASATSDETIILTSALQDHAGWHHFYSIQLEHHSEWFITVDTVQVAIPLIGIRSLRNSALLSPLIVMRRLIALVLVSMTSIKPYP